MDKNGRVIDNEYGPNSVMNNLDKFGPEITRKLREILSDCVSITGEIDDLSNSLPLRSKI